MEAMAYRLSLQGWRALERGAVDEAARALAQSLALRPNDLVTQYRQARLLQAQKNDAAAMTLFESVARDRDAAPPPIYAAACVDAARLHEQHGSTTRAIELYETARGVFGADQLTRDAAERALARLNAASQAR